MPHLGAAQQEGPVPNRPPKKRAPKSSTMSARKWKPAEGDIRTLYKQGVSIAYLRDTVNAKFGFSAT